MNIVMMTNTYTPHVGGVARSVDAFSRAYRQRGHRVLVVAPEFPGAPEGEPDVVRIPAIQNFNGSDFSVVLPVPGYLDDALDDFGPDLVHSHHPFLMGATAIRVASHRDCPLVFTHHTMYEQYTHYVPGDSPALKRFVIKLSTSYANLCDQVFAPSASVAETLRRRGVATPIEVVPTGVVRQQLAGGDGAGFRRRLGIPAAARVIGHVGRLAAEKNLGFLARAMAGAAAAEPDVHCLVVGAGPAEAGIRTAFAEAGVAGRLHLAGKRAMPELADAYHAMDCFAFASLSETQGMVLAEAMAAGLPVVALDAPGAREVVADGRNGRLLAEQDEAAFIAALGEVLALEGEARRRCLAAVAETAAAYDLEACADHALAVYERLDASGPEPGPDRDAWHASLRLVRAEWELLKGMAQAAGAAFGRDDRRNPG